jgi:hypothetical protein
LNAQRLREFCDAYFGEHSGYAQQYLFHHARTALRQSGPREIPRHRKPPRRRPRDKPARQASKSKNENRPAAQVVSAPGLR